jgi:integrase/recombinase XerD
MITWPDTDGAAIERYVRQLRLRHPRANLIYTSELRRFQHFIETQGQLNVRSVQRWLRARSKHWPPHLVIDRACKVSRLLDFLVEEGTLKSQPFAELRSRYGIRSVTAVVQALLSDRSSAALEAARRPPAFSSFLGAYLKDYIELRRAVGYRYLTQAERFGALDRYLQVRPDLEGQDISVLARDWIAEARTDEQRWARQLACRELARAWRRTDPSAPPLRPDPRLKSRVLAARRRPQVFAPEEIRRILETARTWPSPRAPLRGETLYTMVALSYCAGLRISELLRLDIGDVSLHEGTITVRDTKFFKSRRLPLTESALSALREYLRVRASRGGRTGADAPLFWRQTGKGGGRYSLVAIDSLMMKILRTAGLKPAAGRRGPRFHDIRHSFVHDRMMDWYRKGINPQSHLPYLATYLGHKDIYSTLAYLNTTPELLQLASSRFRAYVQHSVANARRLS